MVGPEDDPAGEGEPDVDQGGADEEAEHVWSGSLHGEDQNVVGFEEAEVAEEAEPDEEVAGAEHEAADVPHVANNRLGLDELLDD